MVFSNFDLFSSTFQFNVGKQNLKKRTSLGGILSLLVVSATLIYFIYELLQYFNNKIDPKFISQSFITSDPIDVELHNDLIGFRYEYILNKDLMDLQEKTNKTYLVFIPVFEYVGDDGIEIIQVDYSRCTNSLISGFMCLDFSQIQNYTLTLRSLNDIHSRINILIYRCQDIDDIKTTIPNNCADPLEIQNMVNSLASAFHLKLYTSQYNTTSTQIQTNYRNSYISFQGDQFVYSIFKAQIQRTKVQQGPFFQYTESYQSPIQYDQINSVYDYEKFKIKTGQTNLVQVSIQMDEIVQYIQIQYHSFPEVLAVCNSTLALLMLFGVFARYFASQLIKQDFFLLFLQNMYCGTYENILKLNSILAQNEPINSTIKENLSLSKQQDQKLEELENIKSIIVPSFQSTFIDHLHQKQLISQKSQLEKQISSEQKDNIQKVSNQQSFQTTQFLFKDKFQQQKQNFQISKTQNFESTTNPFINNSNNEEINSFQPQRKTQGKDSLVNSNNQLNFGLDTNMSPYKLQLNYPQSQKKNFNFRNISSIFSNSVFQKIQKIIFSVRLCKKSEYLSSKGLDIQMKKQIEDQVNQSIDILQVYQDIILLKKAIMILFNDEQLAALKLVGFSPSNYDFSSQKQTQNNTEEKNDLNHFQNQYSIYNSEEKCIQSIQKFILRCQTQDILSKIDKRIYSSLSLSLID
ncbi:AMP-binding enzyme family protein (macronuclear) [Tetrahymena thermophila SB210]|uniref:AMP-binding enzyme family protein n=1 Tax=Tetrahymena thermophila (strain SB210) TaxID=312017 RepID=Q23QY8_TETTS|nr:AMP-binding enzyme family protein [Tetrahymena thermophila SB210]EAR98968.2 AMP-binding enzyme family protein [Tetrahymena thermophila SB210]|eukprot:XP_001019213.2 AMP-binding enzyme family protein [Tetrahymena thermophila SB210]